MDLLFFFLNPCLLQCRCRYHCLLIAWAASRCCDCDLQLSHYWVLLGNARNRLRKLCTLLLYSFVNNTRYQLTELTDNIGVNWPKTAVINTNGQIGKQRIGANQWISIILEGINSFFFTSVHRFLSISVDIKIHWLSIFTIGQVGMAYGKLLTGLLDHFLDNFFKNVFGPTFGPFVSDHFVGGGGRPLVLWEW